MSTLGHTTIEDQRLSDEQKLFLPVLVEHIYPEQAARHAGLDDRQVKTWMLNPVFKKEFDSLRRESAQRVAYALEQYANKAVIQLLAIISDELENNTNKLKAIDILLKHNIDYKRFENHEARLFQIEELIEEAKNRSING